MVLLPPCGTPYWFVHTVGFTGYAAYAPSKYAVRGLAECLRNEVRVLRTGIAFTAYS